MKNYLPTNDLLFKKMLTSEDSASILKNFVKDLLGLEFKSLTPKETYHIDSYKKAFENVEIGLTEVDILAITEDGSHATIECQIQPHQYFQERTLFYLVEAFRAAYGNSDAETFIKKNNFSTLRPAYGINIIDFHLFDKEQDALQIYRLLNEKTHQPFLGTKKRELFVLCFLSLKNKHVAPNSASQHWQYFLKTGEVLQDVPSYIKAAKKKISYYQLNKEERTMIMKINKAKAIDDAVRSTQLMEAREEAREEERAKRDREIALNLLKTDLSLIQISEATGMPVEDIQKLKNRERHTTESE